MKRVIFILAIIALLSTQSVSATTTPTCTVNISGALRDQSVQVINDLMGAAMRTGDYMPDIALLQKAQATMTALQNATGPGCKVTY